MKRTWRIGVIGYDGVQGLDLSGPLDVFSGANELADRDKAPYELLILGVKKGAFAAESGLQMLPHLLLDDAPPLDTVIVPGGRGLRLSVPLRTRIAQWLRARSGRIRRVASVCTGIYPLAQSGLLNGRSATTHWRFASDVHARWPTIRLDPNAIFVKDDRYYTSAGITAGIDLSLALVEADLGNELALQVARDLVVYLKRSGGQLQYSEPLRVQSQAVDRFSDIVAWMVENLAGDLGIETLAERLDLSTRHFNRKFKAVFGQTPADFVEGLRLDQARSLLTSDDVPIEQVASTVGYRSGDTFRRAFERRFGVVPSDYRARFGAQ